MISACNTLHWHALEPAKLSSQVYRTLAKVFQYTRAFSDSDDSEVQSRAEPFLDDWLRFV
eukprot:6208677-Pleurochrysis_carterae.AAC.6